jgi:hypothetical protein
MIVWKILPPSASEAMNKPAAKLLHLLPRLTTASTDADAALLHHYLERGDGEAFAELVRRHGPMVFGTP